MHNVLVIDDEIDIRTLLSDILEDEGYTVNTANNVQSAKNQMKEMLPHVIILDIWLEGHHMDGIGLLRYIKKEYPHIPVIMISGHANNEIAVQTIKFGAYDFIEKPFKSEKLLILVKRAAEAKQMMEINQNLRDKEENLHLIGKSASIVSIKNRLKNIAFGNSRVFIEGEKGTGKFTLAQIIHNISRRSDKPFFSLKTTNKKNDEINELLFGDKSKGIVSIFEKANGSTLFIDEITNLSIPQQKKFLEIIENSSINKLKLDIRYIVSSSEDIDSLVNKRKFIPELLSRLKTTHIVLPPLRDRKQDIQELAEHFLNEFSEEIGCNKCTLSDVAYSYMIMYDWPGNVRQLRNMIEKLLLIAQKKNLECIDINILKNELFHDKDENNKSDDNNSKTEYSIGPALLNLNYKDAKKQFDTEYLNLQLVRFNGSINQTASFVGMDRTSLYRKLKECGINADDNKGEK